MHCSCKKYSKLTGKVRLRAINRIKVEFEIIMTVTMEGVLFCDLTLSNLVGGYISLLASCRLGLLLTVMMEAVPFFETVIIY